MRVRRLLIACTILLAAATPGAQAAQTGKAIYDANCATCHGGLADGLPDAVPPLAKNAFVSGNPKAVIHTVLYGKEGPIKVNGKPYNATMPAWKKQLKPNEVAAVITYIRTNFGNKGSAVTSKQVIAVTK